jgi:DNA modification methylase
MGQGTFGISAVKQKRQFIGCEIDADHFANAERMISNAD